MDLSIRASEWERNNMEEKKQILPEASVQEKDKDRAILVPYHAGEEAKDSLGQEVADETFSFVQQDKKIHDVKFTTRPTTFMRDAFRRFRKNRSSVVGGIILGVLFVLSLILPMDGVLPYDIRNTHSQETNLPMKLFSAGNGFWDGTKLYKNSPYPYDAENHYIGEYADDSAIVSITNVHEGYVNTAAEGGKGGYARVYKNAGKGYGYLFSKSYSYDLDNRYSVSYTLGWNAAENFAKPEYALFIRTNKADEDQNKNFEITPYTSDYGTLGQLADAEASIASYETVTVENLSEKIQSTIADPNNKLTEDLLSGGFSLGLIFKADPSLPTALYVHDFEISSSKKSELAQLKARSFGTENAKVADANALIMIALKGESGSNSYWSAASDIQFNAFDTKATTCNIRYDMYKLAYGWRNDLPPFSADVFQGWIDKGYINYTKPEDITVGELDITEAGKASGEVYIRSVEQVDTSLDPNDKSKTIYAFRCTALAYKALGYQKMPIHIFGTERQGKDLFKFVFSGLRTSLLLGIVVALINITIGVIWGSISGYFGGLTDLIMERITDILSGIPWIVLMTVLTLKLGQNFFVFALALCLTGWIGTESITRSQFYRYKGREYVLAARTLGAKSGRLIFRHILPNAIGTIVTSSVLMVPGVIFSEATISFLGLGLQNVDSLGVILSRAETNFSSYPYQLVIPSIIISLLMICFNLFGNGLRDAFNPSLKGSE